MGAQSYKKYYDVTGLTYMRTDNGQLGTDLRSGGKENMRLFSINSTHSSIQKGRTNDRIIQAEEKNQPNKDTSRR